MFTVRWSDTALNSYEDEADFVYKKWGTKETIKFIQLVENFINTLKSGNLIGKPSNKRDIRISVISKQTSLAYKVNEEDKIIYLVLFWNNKMNPDGYKKLIKE